MGCKCYREIIEHIFWAKSQCHTLNSRNVSPEKCVKKCVLSPGPSEVGPEGDEVIWELPLCVPVNLGRGEGLPKHILQVIGVVGPHPVVQGSPRTDQQAGLRQQVGVGASRPGGRTGNHRWCLGSEEVGPCGWGFWQGSLSLWVPYLFIRHSNNRSNNVTNRSYKNAKRSIHLYILDTNWGPKRGNEKRYVGELGDVNEVSHSYLCCSR